jgi:hypothetical protein
MVISSLFATYKVNGLPGTIMTISKDRVKPSPLPDSWKLAEIFTTGIILGGYLAMMTVIFFWAAYKTDFFPVRLIILLINDHKFMQVMAENIQSFRYIHNFCSLEAV